MKTTQTKELYLPPHLETVVAYATLFGSLLGKEEEKPIEEPEDSSPLVPAYHKPAESDCPKPWLDLQMRRVKA